MPPVNTWILAFLERHKMRFDGHDWPERGTPPNKEFVRLWIEAFKSECVSEQDADAASVALGPTPPRYRLDHLPAVLGMIRRIRTRVVPRGLHEARDRTRPPLPPPPGFASWHKWVKAGCPDFRVEDGQEKVRADLPVEKNRLGSPEANLAPQPIRSFGPMTAAQSVYPDGRIATRDLAP